jgi:hypothetical protein
MKSAIYVNTKTLKRDLVDAELSFCLIEPLANLIKKRYRFISKIQVEPFVVCVAKEELSGKIIVVNSSKKYIIASCGHSRGFEQSDKKYYLYLVPKF